jgi:hypothetical protein
LSDWFGSRVCRSLPRGIPLGGSVYVAAMLLVLMFSGAMLVPSLWAQEEENPTTGTIQGTVLDDVGAPVEGAKVL